MRTIVRKIFISENSIRIKQVNVCPSETRYIYIDMNILPPISMKKKKDLLIKSCLNSHLFSI
jgi:hypothetical protein